MMRTRLATVVALAVLLHVAPCGAASKTKRGPGTAKAGTLSAKQSAHFTIKSNLPEPFLDAILNVCEASLDGYRDLFGLYLYPNPYPGDKRMVIYAVRKPGKPSLASHPSLKPVEVHMVAPSDAALNPPGQGGSHHTSEFAREFGRMAVVFDNASFSDGFAAYMASEVVTYVHSRLGQKAWPRPYDYVAMDGPAWLESWAHGAQPGTEQAAALLLSRIGREYGREVIGKAVRLLAMSDEHAVPSQGERGKTAREVFKVAAFCQQLVQLTADGEIVKAFREQHFATVMVPESITSAELWAAKDRMALCRLICDRWGTNVNGILDGSEVVLLFETGPKQRPVGTSRTPDGLTLAPAGSGRTFAWYRPATKWTYVVGRVKVLPSGIMVEDGVIGPDGEPVRR